MNKKQRLYNRNYFLNLVEIGNRKTNCLRWSSNETKEHILKKLEICMDLKKKGEDFITEVIFVGRKARADVLSLDDGSIYEILKSEDIEKAKKKEIYYPSECKIYYIKC